MKHSSRLVECVTVHEVYVRTYVVVKSPDKAFVPLRGREEKKRKENENKRVIQDGRGCRGRIPLLGLGEAQPTAVRSLPRRAGCYDPFCTSHVNLSYLQILNGLVF